MSGPWSDLPPPDQRRKSRLQWRFPQWPTTGRPSIRRPSAGRPAAGGPFNQRRRGSREPIINNWRGLLIIAFLLFVAPVLIRWVVGIIRGMTMGSPW